MKHALAALAAACWALSATAAFASPLTDADRSEILRNSAELLETRYVDPALGEALAAKLRAGASRWDDISDPERFAEALTRWLREQSGDGHLGLSHSKTPLSEGASADAFSASEMERWYGTHVNHGVAKIERLEGNIMLLDLRVFPPPAMAGDVVAAAMTVVAQGDALIIDLRNNGGGDDTGNLIAGYLLDEGQQPLTGSYNRPKDENRARTSPSWVPGRKFGGTKPLYILVSNRTFSAAEAFAYDLQTLGRAVIVGEISGGGAHPFEYRRVHDHFALDLPEARSVNPITGTNWQGVGVRPDVAVPAAEALATAVELAKAELAEAAAPAN